MEISEKMERELYSVNIFLRERNVTFKKILFNYISFGNLNFNFRSNRKTGKDTIIYKIRVMINTFQCRAKKWKGRLIFDKHKNVV